MKKVILSGVLAEKFGAEYELDVHNAREACIALSRMIPGFEAFMANAHLKDIRFAVWHGQHNIGESELNMRTSSEVVRIDPVVGAAKQGVLETIIGAVLIVVGIVVTGMSFGAAAPVGGALIGAGIGLMIGGIMSMLTPQVDPDDANGDGNKPNKGFGGAVTTVAQGNPIPLIYGYRGVGGFLISGEIVPEDQQ